MSAALAIFVLWVVGTFVLSGLGYLVTRDEWGNGPAWRSVIIGILILEAAVGAVVGAVFACEWAIKELQQ